MLFFCSCGTSSPELPVEDLATEDFTEEVRTEEPVEEVEIEAQVAEEVLSAYITRVKTCDMSGTEIYYDGECWYPASVFFDENGERYPVPAGQINQAGDGWAYTDDANQIFAYDALARESHLLMSVLETTDAVSFEWSPDDTKLAIVVVNPEDETYRETYGTKLFMFTFDADGRMLSKELYLFKIKYGCHSGGCHSDPGEDFYFADNDTFVYYTWEGDPYVDRTSEYKRTLSL